MKKEIIVLFILALACKAPVYGQQKYGHINSNEVVQAMPEFKQMTVAVEKRKKDATVKVQGMYDAYQSKLSEMKRYGPSMMAAVREERTLELDSLQKNITNFQQTESGKIQEFQDRLLKPLNDKYLKMLGAVARENGYSYIFDLSSGGIVYHPEKDGDVSELVKKRLGIN